MSLTDGLISYYKMDTGSWTTAFDSVGSNDWTLVWWTTWTTGKIGNWLSFDGINDYVRINDDSSLRFWTWDFTWQIWVKFTATTTKVLLAKWPSTHIQPVPDYVTFITNSTGTITFRIHDGVSYNATSTWIYNDWKRHNVVWVRSWTNSYLYIDAIQDWTSSWISANLDNIEPLVIWNFSYLNNDLYFWWQADEVWIWNRALTQAEISELYNNWDGLQYWQPWFWWDVIKRTNIFFKNN